MSNRDIIIFTNYTWAINEYILTKHLLRLLIPKYTNHVLFELIQLIVFIMDGCHLYQLMYYLNIITIITETIKIKEKSKNFIWKLMVHTTSL